MLAEVGLESSLVAVDVRSLHGEEGSAPWSGSAWRRLSLREGARPSLLSGSMAAVSSACSRISRRLADPGSSGVTDGSYERRVRGSEIESREENDIAHPS